jgi:hypothetical protein
MNAGDRLTEVERGLAKAIANAIVHQLQRELEHSTAVWVHDQQQDAQREDDQPERVASR